MKTIKFDYCSEMLDYLGKLVEEKENISIYCDYNTAIELLDYVDYEAFEEFDIEDLDEDCDEYFFGKVGNYYCGIQKARRDNGELLQCENDYVVILDYIFDREELDSFYGDIDTYLVDFCEDDLDDEDYELAEYNYDEKCDGDCEHCEQNEVENRHLYDVIAEEINEIFEMIDNGACEDCLGKKLMSFFMMGVDMGLQGVFARKE
jgi:hypothetical protein